MNHLALVWKRPLLIAAIVFGSLSCGGAEPVVSQYGGQISAADVQRVVGPIENSFNALPGGWWASTSAPLMGNGDMGVCLLGQPEALCFMLGKNDFWHLKNFNGETSALNFGSLNLSIPALKGAPCAFTQHVADAQTIGKLRASDGTGLDITSMVAATENVLVVRLEAQGKPIEISIELLGGKCRFKEEAGSGSDQGLTWVTRNFTQEVDLPTGASAALKIMGATGPKFTLPPGEPVTLFVAICSNFEAKDHLAAAKQRAQKADATQLWAHHQEWWTGFWSKSLVDVADPELMRRYYTAQYVLGSASRNPKFPPGIIGPWITSSDIFAWGAYWMNYNHAAPYYGLYSSNHLEQADPQDTPMLQFMERGREYASDILKMRGLLYPVGIGPLGFDINYKAPGGPPNLEGGKALTWGQRSDAVYNLINMGQRWRTTHDPVYAKKIYPYVLGVVDFWEDYLTLDGNRYVINNDSVQEGTGANKNPINSLGLVRNAFRLALEMSAESGADQGRRAKWQDILARLSDYPTQKGNGKEIFILSEKGPVVWQDNTVNIQHIYPAGQIGLDSNSRLLQIARDTLTAMSRWYDQNGSNSFFPAAARIGWDPGVLLTNLRRYPMGPNGFFAGNPHGIENCSTVPNTLNEMLMQSHDGLLRIFPVWPKGEPARYLNLRAEGAFLVSAVTRDGIQPDAVRIFSERGLDCTVANPWPDLGASIFRNGRLAATLSGAHFTLKTKPGETLWLGPQGSGFQELTDALTLPPSAPIQALRMQRLLTSPSFFLANVPVTLHGGPDAQIFYTLDGSRPNLQSPRYTTPVFLTKPGRLRVMTVEPAHSERITEYVFQPVESGALLANTFQSDRDLDRVKISNFYPAEPPCRFDDTPSDGRHCLPGEKGVLRLHPLDPQTPALLERVVQIPGGGQHPVLRIMTSGDPNEGGSYYIMQAGVSVNDGETEWFKEEKITAPADGWKTFEYDLSKFAGQTVVLRIKAGTGGAWHNNRAYFHEISVMSGLAK